MKNLYNKQQKTISYLKHEHTKENPSTLIFTYTSEFELTDPISVDELKESRWKMAPLKRIFLEDNVEQNHGWRGDERTWQETRKGKVE